MKKIIIILIALLLFSVMPLYAETELPKIIPDYSNWILFDKFKLDFSIFEFYDNPKSVHKLDIVIIRDERGNFDITFVAFIDLNSKFRLFVPKGYPDIFIYPFTLIEIPAKEGMTVEKFYILIGGKKEMI